RASSICFRPSKIVSRRELIELRVFAIAFVKRTPSSRSTASSCALSSSSDLSRPRTEVENLSSLLRRQKNAIKLGQQSVRCRKRQIIKKYRTRNNVRYRSVCDLA